MSSGFKKPVKRSRRRLVQHDNSDTGQQVTTVEELVQRKKNKIEREKTLESLFQELEQERINQEEVDIYGYPIQQTPNKDLISIADVQFDDNYIMESYTEEMEQEGLEIKDQVKDYLAPEEQEHLDNVFQAIKETEEIHRLEKDWNRPFFKDGIKCIREPCLISRDLFCGQKEIHLSELSATTEGRSFLLASGCMKDWHNSGWKCPHYVYQWLFEVVALDQDKATARNALSTLLMLWSHPDDRNESESREIYEQRYIKLDVFKSVLTAYHAIPTELVDVISMDTEDQMMTETIPIDSQHRSRHIPLSQLGLMIKAFGFSIRLWKEAYMPWEIRYTIRILLQLSLDKAGHLVIQEIQTSIDNCLSALKETWKIDVKNIANDICDMVTTPKQQMHLLDTLKTVYDRSRYLRRVIGITCLGRYLERDVPGSMDNIPVDESLIKQAALMFSYPEKPFTRSNLDYDEYCIRIAMLDAAIGTDDDEIRRERETIIQIADELRLIGLQIGAKLGVMKKTIANEMVQRVWSRISFIIGRDDKIES
ncbi:unnamed protein product [Rhizopus microsporus]